MASMGLHLATVHPGLVEVAAAVCASLRDFGDQLDRFDHVDHEQHRVLVARGERLETHLRSSLLLTDQGLHASALALLRTSMEHMLTDRLLHEGSRYQLSPPGDVTDDAWAAIEAEYDAQATRRSRSWAEMPTRSRNGRVTFTIRGMANRDSDPASASDLLHPVYFEMERYIPTVRRPGDQDRFDDGLISHEHRVRSLRRITQSMEVVGSRLAMWRSPSRR